MVQNGIHNNKTESFSSVRQVGVQRSEGINSIRQLCIGKTTNLTMPHKNDLYAICPRIKLDPKVTYPPNFCSTSVGGTELPLK